MTKGKKKISDIIILYELMFGSFELMFGLGIVFFGQVLLTLYERIIDTELPEGSNAIVVKISENLVPNLLHHRYYIAFLLLGLGIVKVTSGIGLIYKREWAKHLLIIFLTGLIPFDIFAILHHVSFFTLVNLAVNILIILSLIQFQPVPYFKDLYGYIRKKQ